MLYNTILKQSNCEKYLGWYVSDEGLSMCAHKTIEKRSGAVKKAILETKSTIEDSRCHAVGGIATALLIWERSVVEFLLYSSENWIYLSKQSIQCLTNLQNMFLRVTFSMAHSCPLPILQFDTTCLSMDLRVLRKKLLFAFHLENLPPSSLGNQIWKELKILDLPGLYPEVRIAIQDLGLSPMST